MDEQEDGLMARLGITTESKVIYHYAGYRYERLADAVSYARLREAMPEAKEVPQSDEID